MIRSADLQSLHDQLHERVLGEMRDLLAGPGTLEDKRRTLATEVRRMVRESKRILTPSAQNDLVDGVVNTVLGFGPRGSGYVRARVR